jgi:thymidine phosphorylase
MRIYDVITKKKRREALSDEEIREFVKEYTEGNENKGYYQINGADTAGLGEHYF